MSEFKEENLWGIDLGGTKIEGVILSSFEDPKVIYRLRVPTEAHLGYRHILSQFKLLLSQMMAHSGTKPHSIGIASPGTYIPGKKEMKNCNATCINGNDLKSDLESTLGIPVVLANDANCFALAETRLGIVHSEFPEAKVVFGVILGTGVGGGLVVNGQIVQGRHGIGGEWGHNYLFPGEGKPCYCGKTGCNEQIISGPALEAYYHTLSGKNLPLKAIHASSLEGKDQTANLTIDRLLIGFQKALSVVVNIVDPDVFVLGGGVSHINSLYTHTDVLKEMIFNHEFDTPVVKAKLGDSAGVFGAALLVKDSNEFPSSN
ncbi:ROK family protein [Pararhodonellum marinum]|uniref:ROK family protein n=1 Tax=Pararhodonellum marinum TaxID=2755358 RepID=UPI0018904711|nr:ROK family protein [Pararhodonellum marinum]